MEYDSPFAPFFDDGTAFDVDAPMETGDAYPVSGVDLDVDPGIDIDYTRPFGPAPEEPYDASGGYETGGYETGVEEPAEPVLEDDGVYGNANAWNDNWFFQEYDGYCGPSAAAQVIAEYTGLEITDPETMMDKAMDMGLMYNDDPTQGMTLPNLEILLDANGVPSHIEESSMDDLKQRLDAGYGVIAMVDSGEIWYEGTYEEETVEDDTPDHVLVVAGIDENRGVVILSDPGNPNGSQYEVSIETFEDAWADSGNLMLTADEPDPDLQGSVEVPPWAMIQA